MESPTRSGPTAGTTVGNGAAELEHSQLDHIMDSNLGIIMRECDEYLCRLRLSIDFRLEKLRKLNSDVKTVKNDTLWEILTNSLEAFSLLDTAQEYEVFVYKFNNRIRNKQRTLNRINNDIISSKSLLSSSPAHGPEPVLSIPALSDRPVGLFVSMSDIDKELSDEGQEDGSSISASLLRELSDGGQEDCNSTSTSLIPHTSESLSDSDNTKEFSRCSLEELANVDPTFSGKSLSEALYRTDLQKLVLKDRELQGMPLRLAAISKLCELRVKAETYLKEMTPEEIETCIKTRNVNLDQRISMSCTVDLSSLSTFSKSF